MYSRRKRVGDYIQIGAWTEFGSVVEPEPEEAKTLSSRSQYIEVSALNPDSRSAKVVPGI